MKIKGLVDEDFTNYIKPSMFIGTSICNWKCCVEIGVDNSMCQNSPLSNSKTINISVDEIFHRYIKNPITKAIVVGGLEPFLQFEELYKLILYFRNQNCFDDFVIYTGYYRDEIYSALLELSQFKNIIIKYGRYIPNKEKHYDEVLGVHLASDNQYAERIC